MSALTYHVFGCVHHLGDFEELTHTIRVVIRILTHAVVQRACPELVEGLPFASQVYACLPTLVKQFALSYSYLSILRDKIRREVISGLREPLFFGIVAAAKGWRGQQFPGSI